MKKALLLLALIPIAHADHYRAGSLEQFMATPNWELVRQDFDITTGEDFGAPLLVERYRTLAACSMAQQGRLSRPRNVGVKWVIGRFTCRHRGDDVV